MTEQGWGAGGRFEGRVALVTGASRGIGLGIARRLVAEGARVVVTARKPEALGEAVAELGEAVAAPRAAASGGGGEVAIGVAGRADDEEHRADAVRRALDTFGRLDMLVNNTGINPVLGPLVDIDLGAARKIVEVNALAALGWVQAVYRAWMKEHGGAIVNVSSVGGLRPAPGIGLYGASKAMLTYLTSDLALELSPGVRVNGVAPAVVKTRFASALYEGREQDVAATYPLKRLGLPDDVAGAVAFLLSDDASWITGQTVVLDGGLTLTGGV